MSSDIRNESNCRYVLKARRLAIEELESVGWDGKDLDDIVRSSRDKERAERLVSEYKRRANCLEVTGRIYDRLARLQQSYESAGWGITTDWGVRPQNLIALESRAKSLNKSYDPEHPFVSRVLVAHVRDASRILSPAIDCLLSPPDLPKGPWDPELDHVRQCRSSVALPRDFVPFLDRERGEEACETMVTLAEPTKHERELEIEEEPMSTCEEPVSVHQSDGAADLVRSPGGTRDRGGDARKATNGRPRARAVRSRVRVWYTCTYCASETKFESLAEQHEHETKEHPPEVVPAKA
ncbi:hypothetical protein K523DRAFT_285083 [Schizophyllum commune Tattone D]|nr:hypothetical protein K523DRAFT_285083 [Schizophyllum commune Tattone D]